MENNLDLTLVRMTKRIKEAENLVDCEKEDYYQKLNLVNGLKSDLSEYLNEAYGIDFLGMAACG